MRRRLNKNEFPKKLIKYKNREDFPIDRERKAELYEHKNQILRSDRFTLEEIDFRQFLYLVFGRTRSGKYDLREAEDFVLPFQEEYKNKKDNDNETWKYNPIILYKKQGTKNPEKTYNFKLIVTQEMKHLRSATSSHFAIMSPVTYVGDSRKTSNARMCYGLAIDLDYVDGQCVDNVFFQSENGNIPKPNIIVNSGMGLHLYYLFYKPFPMFDNLIELLNKLKYGLSREIWNPGTSRDKNIQFQNIVQGYRIPDSYTKFGKKVVAYWNYNSDYHTIEDLNDFIRIGEAKYKLSNEEIDELNKGIRVKQTTPLEQAKDLWPDWYEKRIVQGLEPGHFTFNPKMYDWWLDKASKEGKLGHRYHVILSIVIMGMKCGIDYEKIKVDCYSLLSPFNELSRDADNPFLESDIKDALKIYGDKKYIRYKKSTIERLTGITLPERKKNGRTRENHLKIARQMKAIKKELGEVIDGRKTKYDLIYDYLSANPNARKVDVIKDLNLAKNTVYKWYDEVFKDISLGKRKERIEQSNFKK